MTIDKSPPKATNRTAFVCDALARDNLLKPEQREAVVARVQRSGERVEETLLELGLLGEAEMLKSLAIQYKAHFISAEKLSKADIGRALLDMIPRRFAEKLGMCPVLFDSKTHALSVVTADPDDVEALQEAQLASGVREVKPILARPAAVKALIAKAYGGDIRAFALLDHQAHAQLQGLLHDRSNVVVDGGEGTAPFAAPAAPAPPPAPPVEATTRTRARTLGQREAGRVEAPRPRAPLAVQVAPSDRGVSDASFVELLNVLVSLLESARADLRGHSAQVARLVRRMAEKMALDAAGTATLVAAAFIHDIGKMGPYHLTTLNCSEYDGHKVAAQKAHGIPGRLLDPVRLPNDTVQAVARMYERFDGKGFPDGVSGKDIPFGARLLAICDTYADLTLNPRNPFRKALSPEDACAALAKYKDTIFDPNLVDLFKSTVLGEELAARLLANRLQALLVDVDPEETTVLELRMIEQGFVVNTARNAEQALNVLEQGDTDLVVSEIDLGPNDGLALLAEARKHAWGKDVPWVVYTRRQERALAQKAFELGVVDYVTKPASAEVLVAKLKALLDQRSSPRSSRGVSGRLREMGLPDMVQVLFHGRKSGSLSIRAPEGQGGIDFVDGNIVDATWGQVRGEEAFFAMLKLRDGEFGLDPSSRSNERVIHQSSEALLLEGMRRLDEGAR